MPEKSDDVTEALEKELLQYNEGMYILRLYIAGSTQRSVKAITSIKEICEKHLQGRVQLEVIDTYQKPQLARKDQVIALPTLIKELPLPLKRIIGDLSDTEKVLVGLDLIEKDAGR